MAADRWATIQDFLKVRPVVVSPSAFVAWFVVKSTIQDESMNIQILYLIASWSW